MLNFIVDFKNELDIKLSISFEPSLPKQLRNGFLKLYPHSCLAGVLTKCKELYNPVTSGKAMMAIYDYADNRYGDGWGPWGGKPDGIN